MTLLVIAVVLTTINLLNRVRHIERQVEELHKYLALFHRNREDD